MSNFNPPANGFKKGQSGNPKGAPKKDESLTGLLRAYMDETVNPEGKKRKEAFIQAVAKHAVKGDPTLIKYLWDRLDGQMKQEILMQTTTISILPPKKPEEADAETLADTSEEENDDSTGKI